MASKASKAIKQICIDREISLAELSNMYGIEKNSFYVKLCRDRMPYSDVEKIMDLLDCDIQFKDRKTGKVY